MLIYNNTEEKNIKELYQKIYEDDIPLKIGSFDPEYIYIAKMKNLHWRPC